MVTNISNKVKMRKTWQGYELSIKNPDGCGELYVASIYDGKISWVWDYTHARNYRSKAYAEAIAKDIEEGRLA